MVFKTYENDSGIVYNIIDKSASGKYTLLSAKKKLCTPFVIAYRCYGDGGSWGQGHYYASLGLVMKDWLDNYVEQ